MALRDAEHCFASLYGVVDHFFGGVGGGVRGVLCEDGDGLTFAQARGDGGVEGDELWDGHAVLFGNAEGGVALFDGIGGGGFVGVVFRVEGYSYYDALDESGVFEAWVG